MTINRSLGKVRPRAPPEPRSTGPEHCSHLALGQGMYYCLGAPLARMEIQIALHTLLHRFPQLDLVVPPQQLQWRTSFRSRALKAVPVTLR
ncbi:cytochrome P450 [Streptomyces violaceusniger]|uniref:cytochrome P450 n=1 Tax=Streptomyces violaceusniger TaxID=68280 RepID=UPI003365032B